MWRPAHNARLAALLLLLAAALASASSQPAHPTVMDTLRAGLKKTDSPAKVSAASMQSAEYGYDSGYHTEQKELCLVEKERDTCFPGLDTAETLFWS
jgi:hypothetical protein